MGKVAISFTNCTEQSKDIWVKLPASSPPSQNKVKTFGVKLPSSSALSLEEIKTLRNDLVYLIYF